MTADLSYFHFPERKVLKVSAKLQFFNISLDPENDVVVGLALCNNT